MMLHIKLTYENDCLSTKLGRTFRSTKENSSIVWNYLIMISYFDNDKKISFSWVHLSSEIFCFCFYCCTTKSYLGGHVGLACWRKLFYLLCYFTFRLHLSTILVWMQLLEEFFFSSLWRIENTTFSVKLVGMCPCSDCFLLRPSLLAAKLFMTNHRTKKTFTLSSVLPTGLRLQGLAYCTEMLCVN